jgi:hypothetical protein
MAGSFQGALILGSTTLGNPGAFVAKMDPNGNPLWSLAFGASGSTSAVSFVATDPAGNVVVVGTFTGTINCGGSSLTASGPSAEEIFVAKLDPNGNQVWSKSFGDGTNTVSVGSLALAGTSGVVLAGTYDTSIAFGGPALTPAGTATAGDFVVALDAAAGGYQWSQNLPSTGSLYAAVDANQNVVLAGSYSGTVSVGGSTLTSVGSDDIFVARLDPSGNPLWAKSFGGPGDDEVGALSVDASGGPVLSGLSTSGVDFGGGTLPLNASYAVRLSNSGSFGWSLSLGSGAQIQSVAGDASGNVLLAGSASGPITVGSTTLPESSSGFDFLALELDPNGNLVSSFRAGNGSGLTANAISVNAADEVAAVAAARAGTVDMGSSASDLTCAAVCGLVTRLSL